MHDSFFIIFFFFHQTGDEYLVEHEIKHVLINQNNHLSGSSINVTIVLRRRPQYHITNTFIQILMLLMIGYLSLFFDIDNFTDKIMVTLTTLLVLATIMTSIQGVS